MSSRKQRPSSLIGSGGGDANFNLSHIHQKAASYDTNENFDFKKPSRQHAPDASFFSLPPAVSNSKLTWKDRAPKPLKSQSASRLLSQSQSGPFGNNRPESVTRPSNRVSLTSSGKMVLKNGAKQVPTQAIDELSFAAVQSNSEHTWQYVGRVNASYERPAMRSDVLGLEGKFDAAMDNVDKGQEESSGGAGITAMDRDLMNIRGQVNSQFPDTKDSEKERLTAAMYEQKWTDLVLGELEDQMLVSCLEQGRLLRKLRARYAAVFGRMQQLHGQCLQDYSATVRQMSQYKHDISELESRQLRLEEDLNAVHRIELDKLKTELSKERADCELETETARAEVEKMSETIKTLNVVFKQLSNDADGVRFTDLLDAHTRLEAQMQDMSAELRKLRPLTAENDKIKMEARLNEAKVTQLRTQLEQVRLELSQKEVMCEELMARESERLTQEEMAAQEAGENEEEGGDGAQGGQGGEGGEGGQGGGEDDAEEMELVEGETLQDVAATYGYTVNEIRMIGIRVSRATDFIIDVNDLMKKKEENERKRLPCTGYRILLPNLMGYRPTRARGWVLSCMRAILRAKQLADAVAVRSGQLRMRMPEFVYTWYEPTDEAMQSMGAEAREAAVAKADEDRWALYYGVKVLMKELPEAKLWYSLLDERYGEDECMFYLYCMRVLEGVAGGTLNWGARGDCSDYARLSERIELQGEEAEIEPEVVWVDIRYTGSATDLAMAKATSEERQVVIKKTMERATDAEGKVPPEKALRENGEPAKVVDLYYWLTVMIKEYREEQSHRRAAVRLMFNTASSGALTGGVGAKDKSKSGGDGKKDGKDSEEEAPTLDMQQFCAMVLTLNQRASAGDVAGLFRDAFDLGNGLVTYESFMTAADKAQFFSACLRLPPFLGANHVSELSQEQQFLLGSVVHRHVTFFQQNVNLTSMQLPLAVRMQLASLQADLADTLSEGPKGNTLDIDGRRPLCAYRRILDLLLHVRMIWREDSGEPGRNDAVYRADHELTAMENVLSDFSPNTSQSFWEILRMRVATVRVQRKWRARLRRDEGVPFSMRKFMGKRYCNGQDRIKRRHVIRSAAWTLGFVHQLYAAKMRDDADRRALSLPPREFTVWMYEHVLALVGVRSVAERVLHDLSINLVAHRKSNARCKLFSHFLGMGQSAEEKALHGSGPHALTFALQLLSLVSQQQQVRSGAGYGTRNKLFPETTGHFNAQDGKSTVLQAHAEEIVGIMFKAAGEDKVADVTARVKKDAKQPGDDAKQLATGSDLLLAVCIDEYSREHSRRNMQLRTRLEERINNSPAGTVAPLEYHEFEEILVEANEQIPPPQLQMMYQELMRTCTSETGVPETTRVLKLCSRHLMLNFMTADPTEQGYEACPEVFTHAESLSCLKEIWGGYKGTTEELVGRLKTKAKATPPPADAANKSTVLTLAAVMAVEQAHQKLQATIPDVPVMASEEEVQKAWAMFRAVLFELNRLSVLAAFEPTALKDRWDL